MREKSVLRISLWLLTIFLVVSIHLAKAEQPTDKIPRIGYMHTGSSSDPVNAYRLNAFRRGLRGLGYVEAKNIIVEYRFAEGNSERLRNLIEELIRLKVDILVLSTATAARTAKTLTTTIPIVVINMGNPRGLVDSLARPGGNITGLTHISSELLGKRLELLRESVPTVYRFGILYDEASGGYQRIVRETQSTAKSLGVELQVIQLKTASSDIEATFQTMAKKQVGAFVTEATPRISLNRQKILALAERNRLPAMHSDEEWVNDGGLMSYGASRNEPYHRAAIYVDKILKGSKPADLPVQQPTKFEFAINLKTAKQIGLTIPPNVLTRADRVIK